MIHYNGFYVAVTLFIITSPSALEMQLKYARVGDTIDD